MDRDKRWERICVAYEALCAGKGEESSAEKVSRERKEREREREERERKRERKRKTVTWSGLFRWSTW